MDQNKQELDELRREKIVRLCNEVKDSVTLSGEQLDRTMNYISEIQDIQERRITSFREYFRDAEEQSAELNIEATQY